MWWGVGPLQWNSNCPTERVQWCWNFQSFHNLFCVREGWMIPSPLWLVNSRRPRKMCFFQCLVYMVYIVSCDRLWEFFFLWDNASIHSSSLPVIFIKHSLSSSNKLVTSRQPRGYKTTASFNKSSCVQDKGLILLFQCCCFELTETTKVFKAQISQRQMPKERQLHSHTFTHTAVQAYSPFSVSASCPWWPLQGCTAGLPLGCRGLFCPTS